MKDILQIVNRAALAAKIGVSRQALAHWEAKDPDGLKPGHAWSMALDWLRRCEYSEFLDVVSFARLPAYLETDLSVPTLKKRAHQADGWTKAKLKLRLKSFQERQADSENFDEHGLTESDYYTGITKYG